MSTKSNAGWRGAVVALGVLANVAVPATAQTMSEKAVKTFMDYAWQLTPAKFTRPDGKVIEVDKRNRDAMTVPVDIARDVISAGRLSAHAQICELPQDQVENYRSLMRREDAKKKWTEQQMIYINQLHLTTVMLLTGKIKVVEEQEGGKTAVIDDAKISEPKTCTTEQAKKVKELIQAYVKSGPPPPAAAAAPAAPAATPAAPAQPAAAKKP
jgi:hypothetical protein